MGKQDIIAILQDMNMAQNWKQEILLE